MIVHIVDIRESGPAGLIAVLKGHNFARAGEAEARLISEAHGIMCYVEGCDRGAGYEIVLHRRHSRHYDEIAYLCATDCNRHQDGEPLRLRVESHR